MSLSPNSSQYYSYLGKLSHCKWQEIVISVTSHFFLPWTIILVFISCIIIKKANQIMVVFCDLNGDLAPLGTHHLALLTFSLTEYVLDPLLSRWECVGSLTL